MKHRILLIALLCGLTAGVHAQSEEENMRAVYDQAEQDYNIGRFEAAQTALKQNLKNFPVEMLQSGYRMLALCYLAMDQEDNARYYASLLLAENPYYSTTLSDPQRFTDMVESLRAGLTATITTASSQAERLQEVPVPTTLITEEMIRNSGARNLQEVLAAYVPGMYIIDCNDDINIAMRGIYSSGQEKILFMLNGHRLNSYCTNTSAPDFSISLEKLKQIEVLRGPASSLYGGVALTAVVNLITKQGADLNGIKARVGAGNYGQYQGDVLFGKRYFDLDMLIWGSMHGARGERVHVDREDTGLGMTGGDVTVGGIGDRPNYDFGISLKYKQLQFLYNSQSSQIQAPMTMTHTFSPYDIGKYRTFYGYRPSRSTTSHHADISYGHSFGNVFLKGQIAYDNSSLGFYQVISDATLPGFSELLPLPETSKAILAGGVEGIGRYISGQEHTFGAKIHGDWTYIDNGTHKGLLTFGTEYSYFKLDDARYVFVYDFTRTLPETINISEVGKGHENNANVYLQLKHQWGPFILNAGLRFDYKDRYDSTRIHEFSPRAALIYVRPKWNVKLSYAKAFTDAPYLYRKTNQFLLALDGAKGRDQLSLPLTPETMHSYQLTLAATQWVNGLDMELNAFLNRTRDLIYMDLIEHYNTGNSNIYGLEFTASYRYRRLAANLSVAWRETGKYELLKKTYTDALNMPKLTVKSVLAWQATKKLRLHTHFAYNSRQKTMYIDLITQTVIYKALNVISEMDAKMDQGIKLTPEEQQDYEKSLNTMAGALQNMYPVKDIPPFFIIDLGAEYQIGRLGLGLNIHNLLNRRYKLSGANTGPIPQKGRWFMFDISYKF